MTPQATISIDEWTDRWEPTPIIGALHDLLHDLEAAEVLPEAITIAMGASIEAHLLREGRAFTLRILTQVVKDLQNNHPEFAVYPQ